MMLGFLFFDLIMDKFVRGRKIPAVSHLFKPKGWVFLSFLVGIAFASIASTALSQILAEVVTQKGLSVQEYLARLAIADLFLLGFLLLYFEMKIWKVARKTS
jgi:endonuclease/exonuclease/phosphatase (EEP) superfamily protein YafD